MPYGVARGNQQRMSQHLVPLFYLVYSVGTDRCKDPDEHSGCFPTIIRDCEYRTVEVVCQSYQGGRSIGVDLPWDYIRIPQTKSVKRFVTGNKKALNFRLEVQGATTGTLRDSLCRTCTEREPRNSLIPRTLVDFTSKTDIVDLCSLWVVSRTVL